MCRCLPKITIARIVATIAYRRDGFSKRGLIFSARDMIVRCTDVSAEVYTDTWVEELIGKYQFLLNINVYMDLLANSAC